MGHRSDRNRFGVPLIGGAGGVRFSARTAVMALVLAFLLLWLLWLNALRPEIRSVGHIYVRCPAGAEISIDGVFRGLSEAECGGLVIPRVPVGEHEYRAAAGESHEYGVIDVTEDALVVIESESLRAPVSLTQNLGLVGRREIGKASSKHVGSLSIESRPPMCKISIEALGLTGLEKTTYFWLLENIPCGRHIVRATALDQQLDLEILIVDGRMAQAVFDFVDGESHDLSAERRKLANWKSAVGMDFTLVTPGAFVMGVPCEEAWEPTQPPHCVVLTKPFAISTYEVTQAAYEAIMGYNPSEFKGSKRPVENVS